MTYDEWTAKCDALDDEIDASESQIAILGEEIDSIESQIAELSFEQMKKEDEQSEWAAGLPDLRAARSRLDAEEPIEEEEA